MTHPLGYLIGYGARSIAVSHLIWFTLGVSLLVCAIITGLVGVAIARGRRGGVRAAGRDVAVTRGGSGVRWIWIGLAIAMVPLLITLVWTMALLAQVAPAGPGAEAAMTIDVVAHQWWWELRYNGAEPAETFTTANEIHIPVGVPVLVRLHSNDVIHSFWVPRLAGKMDVVPGQTNMTWFEAQEPGIYRGQCAEFCGAQHAHMAFEVIAEPRSRFDLWRRAQLQTAPPPVTPAQQRGLALVEFRCALCHTVRGTNANASAAPDLTHLMSRRTIAAGTLANTPGNLSGWIENPQAVKPGAQMPDQTLSGPQLNDIRAYLETLR